MTSFPADALKHGAQGLALALLAASCTNTPELSGGGSPFAHPDVPGAVPPESTTNAIALEAESGVLSGTMKIRSHANASGREYVATDAANQGAGGFTLDIAQAGDYVIWARVWMPAPAQDSFSVTVDSEAEEIFYPREGWGETWQWKVLNGRDRRLFSFHVGRHRLTFRGRETGAGLDRVIVTSDLTFAPSELVAVPAAPAPNNGPAPAPEKIEGLFVAANGSSNGDGSLNNPWDLETALLPSSGIEPGDTVWLRGGTYTGAFTSRLSGTIDKPITFRSYASERAIFAQRKGEGLSVLGNYTHWRDIEITTANSTDRIAADDGVAIQVASQVDLGAGIRMHGDGTKLINSIVHDVSYATRMQGGGRGMELYGCIIFHNGWQGPKYLQGVGLYGQGHQQKVTDNIFFNNGRVGAMVNSSSGAHSFEFSGNIAFSIGTNLGIHTYATQVWPMENMVFKDNYTYNGGVSFGYLDRSHPKDAIAERNWFVTGSAQIRLGKTPKLSQAFKSFRGNTVYAPIKMQNPQLTDIQDSFQRTYPDNRYLSSNPGKEDVFLRPNRYQRGRAHIVVYNWPRKQKVSVELADSGLRLGERYEIRDVQNLAATPLLTGVYSGSSVSIPMHDLTLVQAQAEPPGWRLNPYSKRNTDHQGPEFAVFLLTSSQASRL